MIRVVIAEDSVTQREILRRLLDGDGDFVVVGEARNGFEAVELAERLRPDVVLMDIHMPLKDGVEATREIMERFPVPIVIASATLKNSEIDLGLAALKAGAVSVIQKPAGAVLLHLAKIAPELKRELQAAAAARVVRSASNVARDKGGTGRVRSENRIQLVGICASTGGPAVLAEILSKIPHPYPIPILLVQHIGAGFVQGFARWLGEQSRQSVQLAVAGQTLLPGVWMAAGGLHLELGERRTILSRPGSAGDIHCPSGDVLLESIARHAGKAGAGIVLTGMGSDGAKGLAAVRAAGGRTVAQNEASSLIYGMPKAARELGAAELELDPRGVADFLSELAGSETHSSEMSGLRSSTDG